MSGETAVLPENLATPAQLMAQAGEHERAGRLAEARACAEKVLEIEPEHADALQLLGAAAFQEGRIDEALRLMERSREIDPNKTLYARNLCEVYRLLGRYDEALEAGLAAVRGDPRDAIAQVNLSVLRLARGEPTEAIICAERALAIDPNMPGAHFGLAEALLLQGVFAKGWDEYEWRFRLKGVPTVMPRNDIPQWDGAKVNGRVILIADQGFGDCIQFCRYIPWVAERCDEVVVAAGKEMQPLIAQFPQVASMFDQWNECPDAVGYIPLSGLPRLAGTNLSNIPAGIPYLTATDDKTARWADRLNLLVTPRHKRVGIVWAGRPTHRNDHNRSLALKDLAPITSVDGVSFISLQKGPPVSQISQYVGRAPLVNLGPEIDDFVDTIAVINALDMVITVDTAVGHLTGASGKPVWIMIPYAPDWRWLEKRTDTPWYPTARLFRQAAPREWAPVIQSVADEMARVLAEKA